MHYLPQSCCYNTETQGLIKESCLGEAGPVYLYHPGNDPAAHMENDLLPKRWCCALSDNCADFYRLRPLDTCDKNENPREGW